MKLLLDSHVLLWVALQPEQLSPAAQQALKDENNELLVSLATPWELAIKISLGKLEVEWSLIEKTTELLGARWMPVKLAHAAAVATLPFHHRDPFDRLLIAQALHEDLFVVSADASFDLYGLRRIW